MMRLHWRDLGAPRADKADGEAVEIVGWPATATSAKSADYFLLTSEPSCCAGCLPANPLAVLEVFADRALELPAGPMRLSGTLAVLEDDPVGWRYQLRGARVTGGVTRRRLLAASPLVCLPMPAMAQATGPTIDIHSHGGSVIKSGFSQFTPLAEPMRQGGMAVICLAVVSDSPTITLTGGRLRPSREGRPGEFYDHTQRAFERLHRLVTEQGFGIITDAAGLRAARPERPSVIVSVEGGDFLEGKPERVDEARARWQLRHLQLTHYRPNELGDIQTEPAVHGGLTPAGADVIRRCNALGVVVDVAHGTYDLVKAAAKVATKPLVLSHTSLTQRPAPWTRLITPDHAKAVASTGGVIGIWPLVELFPTYQAYAGAFARMVDFVGIDHVGLGTDQMGLVGGSTLPSYAELPQLAAALRGKFTAEETAKLLGGNYQRVFQTCIG
jgi:membrane dipeptidase